MKNYKFGMNDENGRLIEIYIPAETEEQADQILFKKFFIKHDGYKVWLNDVVEY